MEKRNLEIIIIFSIIGFLILLLLLAPEILPVGNVVNILGWVVVDNPELENRLLIPIIFLIMCLSLFIISLIVNNLRKQKSNLYLSDRESDYINEHFNDIPIWKKVKRY